METHHQEQQCQAPSQPWYPTPPPPVGFHQFPQYSLPPAPQPQSYHQQPPLWKPAVPDFTPYHQLQQSSRLGLPPPPPPPAYHHGVSPPFPNGPPAYLPHSVPPPTSYVNAARAQQNYPIPPPNQAWGNSSWHHPQGWDHPARSMSYNNEEDWAARAREWAEEKSSTENHHNQMHFSPAGGMESHSQVYHEPIQQAAGPPTESQQSSFSTSQQTPISTAVPQKQANHMQDTTSFNLDLSSYSTDARMLYSTRPESLTEENGKTKSHGNFSSSVFAQEVPSTYSSSSGKNDGDQNESSNLPLPPPPLSFQEGPNNSNPMLQFQSIKAELQLQLHPVRGCMAPSIDASDQPLIFNQRFNFDHGQNQNTSYRDVDMTGSFRGIESIGVAPPFDAWTPPVAFSQMATIPSGQQAPMFGRMPAPGFHPSIPSIRAPFGVGLGTLNHLSAFPEDSGAFSSIERPKKASVPNWLREELLKKKASIASNFQEQPIGNSHSGEGGDDDKSFENDDHADNKSFDSAKSGEDDEDAEDDVEAKRTAAINQEIKLVLTDILLKVTDDLFEEIAAKVINEDDDLTMEEGSESSVNPKASLSPLASAAPKSSKIPVSPGSITRIEQVEKSTSAPVGNILGLANYASDDEDEDTQSSVTLSSVTLDDGNQQQINNADSATHIVKMEEKETHRVKIESDRGSLLISSGGKEKSLDGALHLGEWNNKRQVIESKDSDDKQYKVASGVVTEPSERPVSVPPEKVGKVPSEHDNGSQRKQSIKETPSKEEKIIREKRNGQLDYHVIKSGSKAGHVSRDADKGRHEETKIGTSKLQKQYSNANELPKGCVDSQTKEQTGKSENIERSSKGKESKQEKSVDKSESRMKNIRGSDKSLEDSERYKNIRYKEENPRKRDRQEDRKEGRAGREEKDSHRHRKKHSPSPIGKHINSKNSASSGYGGVSSGEVSADPKKRQISRSPHTKHSQRKHSPHSYSKTRRISRSRSSSPVRRKR